MYTWSYLKTGKTVKLHKAKPRRGGKNHTSVYPRIGRTVCFLARFLSSCGPNVREQPQFRVLFDYLLFFNVGKRPDTHSVLPRLPEIGMMLWNAWCDLKFTNLPTGVGEKLHPPPWRMHNSDAVGGSSIRFWCWSFFCCIFIPPRVLFWHNPFGSGIASNCIVIFIKAFWRVLMVWIGWQGS